MKEKLPQPFAACLARSVKPRLDSSGKPMLGATGDDNVSGNTTYTDD